MVFGVPECLCVRILSVGAAKEMLCALFVPLSVLKCSAEKSV